MSDCRIAVDASVLEHPLTGVAKAMLGLYTASLSLRTETDVVALHRKPLTTELPEGMQSVRFGSRLRARVWRALALPAHVAVSRRNVVHFPWSGSIPVLLPGSKVVMTLHDVLPLVIPGHLASDAHREAYIRRVQKDVSRADLILTDSEYSKRSILEHFRTNAEPEVVYLGPSVTMRGTPDQGGSPYFVYVGGYHPRKGIGVLVRVFGDLARQGLLHERLVLTGARRSLGSEVDGPIREGVEAGYIVEAGYVSDEELAKLMASAVALVYPSKYEGFGLPPLDAMSLGCPVLTARETSLPEVCGDAALYFDPDNEKDFAEALLAVSQRPDIRCKLREAGLKQAATFTWEAAARKYLGLLDNLVSHDTRVGEVV